MKTLDREDGLDRRRAIDSSMQEEIARTYFDMPDKSPKPGGKKRNISKLPWIIAAVALVFGMAAFLSKSNIDIKVRILSEVPSSGSERRLDEFDELKDKGFVFVSGSEINSSLVKHAYFDGDAKNYSRQNDSELVLCNSKGSGWANYTIELKEPIDLTKLDLKYIAKGAKGQEALGIVIIDTDNRSYRVLDPNRIGRLTKDWRDYRMNFTAMKNVIDLNNISSIKLEFGSLTVQNSTAAIIFLKGIYAAKTKRTRWL